MSNKGLNTAVKNNVKWLDEPENKLDSYNVGLLIEKQFKATYEYSDGLIQELIAGVFMLTLKEPDSLISLNLKKICDRVQYSLLPENHNNDPFAKFSYFQLRNICHTEQACHWAQLIGRQDYSSHRIHTFFFYNLDLFDCLWKKHLSREGFHIKEYLSNRLMIISDGTYNYPYNLGKLPAFCLWRQQPIKEIIKTEIDLVKKRFSLFPKIYESLSSSSDPYSWSLNNGEMIYSSNKETCSFDYASIVDDILHSDESHNTKNYINNFKVSDIDSRYYFPTISVRSLIHLRARPSSLSSLQNGYALCAALEKNGKQKPVETKNENSLDTFHLWFKRAIRHLSHHQYHARIVMIEKEATQAFSLVGEQVASIAVFPKLIKGVLEQLNFGQQSHVRLIAHNEDVLTIAFKEASWNEINEVNHKAMSLFKMVSSDGADPLSLFEEIELPPHGVGTFHLSLVPNEYFELIDTAITLKYSLPPGHDHYLLGLSYECLHEWALAVNEFEKALRLDSQDSNILSALGSSLMELGSFEHALPFIKRAYEKLPEDADLANTLGKLHLNFGNIDDAIKAFERAVRLSPGSAKFLANLGKGYLLAARTYDALETLNQAVRCDPNCAIAHHQLAELHLQSGDEEQAKKHALIAYRENPHNTNIANLLWRLTVGKKNQRNNS